MHPLFAFARWSLDALAKGKCPLEDYAGNPFCEEDGDMFRRRGTPLALRGCVLYLKADWAEFAHSLSYVSWQSTLFPCMLCKTIKSTMHAGEAFAPLFFFPWALLTEEDHEAAAAAREVRVALSRDDHALVVSILRYQKQKDGPAGRALTDDVGRLGLRKGDRLEPTPTLLDVADFDSVAEFPYTATFWRRDAESRVRHRNPLMDSSLGLTHERLALDLLHTLFLGPALVLVGHVFWFLIEHNVWRVGAGTAADRWQLSVQQLRTVLIAWYKEQRSRGKNITELEDLTVNMLGGKPGEIPSFKAVETKHLLPFCVELIDRHHGDLPVAEARPLFEAVRAMVRMCEIFDTAALVVPTNLIQELHDCYNTLMECCKIADVPLKPKNHLLAHLIHNVEVQGNPRYYACFEDEGLNAVLRGIGQSAHRAVWAYRIFANWERVEQESAKKRKTS